jgi:hypothetical protein
VRDVPACSNHDNENLAAVEGDEIQVLELRRVSGRSNGKAHLVRGARNCLGSVREHVVDRAGAAKACFDLRSRSGSAPFDQELVHVDAIAKVRRDTAS